MHCYSVDMKKALEVAKALDELLVCYRIGKSPSERLFLRLEKARKTIEDWEKQLQTERKNHEQGERMEGKMR